MASVALRAGGGNAGANANTADSEDGGKALQFYPNTVPARYGKEGALQDFSAVIGQGTTRTIHVDSATGALTLTPAPAN